jgi:hypothetical protein
MDDVCTATTKVKSSVTKNHSFEHSASSGTHFPVSLVRVLRKCFRGLRHL